MNVWTSWACDTVKARQGMADDQYVMLSELKEARLNLICHLMGTSGAVSKAQ